MKYLIIAAAVAIFAAYCYGVATNVGTVPLPTYTKKIIDITGGNDWQKEPSRATERLRDLARARYLAADANGNVKADKVLTDVDFREIVEKNPPAARAYAVYDQNALLDLADKRYRLNETLTLNNVVYAVGAPVEPGLLKNAIADGKVAQLSVSGAGETISIQPGTMFMIVTIFVGLLCALKIVLYEPLLKIIDARNAEISAGAEYARNNISLATALEDERNELRLKIRRDHLAHLGMARYEVVKVADELLKNARAEARKVHETSMQEIESALRAAKEKLQQEVPTLARQIVKQTLGLAVGEKL